MPKVSVLMPAFNASRYIKEAIDSILAQTFTDFELIILNDGSRDDTVSLVKSYSDSRIRLIENEGNKGLAFTRNRLIDEAQGDYIAWLDSDDIAFPNRIEKEVNFLEKNKKYALVASWAKIIDSDSQPTGSFIKSYIPNQHLTALLLFVNYIVQSSVMIRKSMLPTLHYNLDFPPTEDYELWVRIAQKHPIAILSEVLVDYRIHTTNISQTQNEKAKQTVQLNHKKQIELLGIIPEKENIALHYEIGFGKSSNIDLNFLTEAEKWLKQIEEANKKMMIYKPTSLSYILSHRWLKLCTANKNLGLKAVKRYFSSNFAKLNFYHLALILKYLILR